MTTALEATQVGAGAPALQTGFRMNFSYQHEVSIAFHSDGTVDSVEAHAVLPKYLLYSRESIMSPI